VITKGSTPIKWPGWRSTAWHDVKELDVRSWWGGQVDGMRDVSGQMYMRNRYLTLDGESGSTAQAGGRE
jgi:hypothetical protein